MTGPKKASYQPGDILSRAEAISLLSARDRREKDSDDSARDRWRNRINNHTRKGTLPSKDGRYLVEDLAAWARNLRMKEWKNLEWHQALVDLPNAPGTLIMSVEGFQSKIIGYCLPPTLEAAHKDIIRLTDERFEFLEEIARLNAELVPLRELNEKYQQSRLKRKRAAQKRRLPEK